MYCGLCDYTLIQHCFKIIICPNRHNRYEIIAAMKMKIYGACNEMTFWASYLHVIKLKWSQRCVALQELHVLACLCFPLLKDIGV